MNSDAYKLLHCGIDVLVVGQPDQSDTEWNPPSHRLRNVGSVRP